MMTKTEYLISIFTVIVLALVGYLAFEENNLAKRKAIVSEACAQLNGVAMHDYNGNVVCLDLDTIKLPKEIIEQP